ncbi:hypothetical protein [Gimesia sp.]|nr:hypothetical protein [Gimesia sp.]
MPRNDKSGKYKGIHSREFLLKDPSMPSEFVLITAINSALSPTAAVVTRLFSAILAL